MSYGYQGPPFPGQQPPTSFGLPPGTPSAPSAPPHNSPYPNAPTAFGMPQPSSMYPNSYNPSMPQPEMPQPSMPQPFSNPAYPTPQPMYGSQGYQPQPQYPGQHPQSYPSQPPQPYPSQPPQPYPSQPPQPYPSQPPQPYPSQPNPYQQPQNFPPSTPSNPAYGPSGGSMYPNLPPVHGSDSTPYSGGGHSGGRGTSGNFAHGGAPYGAPAPRITKAPAKLSPTVFANDGFNPRNDAEILRKAMKGFGTDEKSIIQVLANRTNVQRQEIALQFKTLYGKDLLEDLKSETSGNFKKLLVAMMTPLPQYFAKELHDAMSGVGTDESVLIEVLCTMSNHEIRVIKQAYESMYNKSLEDDLREDTSGSFKRLMVSLCCANRDETFNVDPAAAANEARQLLQAGELQFGTDESVFNAILVQRNIAQLNQIFAEYLNITGHDIETAIENEFSGDIQKGLLAIVKCVKNRAGYFAERIQKSMKGMGTKDQDLMRLIVTRSEIDMGEIKQAFQQQYGQSLENFIADDCSGDYKKCLIALIS